MEQWLAQSRAAMQSSMWSGPSARGGGGGGGGRRPSSAAAASGSAAGPSTAGGGGGSGGGGGGYRFPHSEHSRERHRAENLSASRSLLDGSGEFGPTEFPDSAHLTAGCPRLRVLRLAELPPPSTPTSSSGGGRTLTPPSFLLTLPDEVEESDTNITDDADDVDEQLQQLQMQRRNIEASIRSLAASIASSAQQQLVASGEPAAAVAELHVDSRLSPDSPEERHRIRRKKLRRRALVGVYLAAVLLAVLAVVFLAAKGVFYTAEVSGKEHHHD